MGRIKILLWLLLFPLAANASWTYVGTSTPTTPGNATYTVTTGQFVVITAFSDAASSFTLTMTDSVGNSYTNEPTPGDGTATSYFLNTVYLGCSPQTLYSNLVQKQYYGFATHSGTGVTITIPWSTAGSTVKYIEAQTFTTTYTYAHMDYFNGTSDFGGVNYFASPQSTTPAGSDELWITSGFKMDTVPSLSGSTPTATTALTAVGGTSFNYYSIPVGAQTFTYAANSASTCTLPPNLTYDSYLIWFSTMGFIGSNPAPGGTKQPSVNVYID